MKDTTLGTTPPESAQRDAIHIAIAPVVAGAILHAGMRVILEDGKAIPSAKNSIGIVDPFIRQPIREGERFWLLLHQNTIVGMRHHWSHPAFSDLPPNESRAPASEAWLRSFADQYFGGKYGVMMDRAKGGDLCFSDDDYPEDQSEKFWIHYSAVTGLPTEGYFSCAC